jgi:cysteinyl-tRNA synthetase
MPIKVYNTLSRKKEELRPGTEGELTMYVCGPTVYDLSHIGHARSAVAFDVIYRYLKYRGFEVTYTRNYTDVDDKILDRAREEGISSKELAERNIKAFDEDMDALGVAVPERRPRATETIKEMIGLVERLVKKGYAYEVDGDVYFTVRKFKGYGRLSGKNIEELESGARVEVDERKEDPLDFALWKATKPGEDLKWPSPWGEGRPGWHIECSAMCMALGKGGTVDIHGGGKDLIFPHHENERAQSEAAMEMTEAVTGKTFIRYWLHNGFVNIDREKMSKSLGNILNIRDVLREYSKEAVRIFLLSNHYRSPIDYTRESLKEAEAAVERVYRTLERMERDRPVETSAPVDEHSLAERFKPVIDAMDDDFNTAEAIGIVFKDVNTANRLMDGDTTLSPLHDIDTDLPLIKALIKEAGSILGLFCEKPSDYFDRIRGRAGVPAEEIERLISEREEARKGKDFKRADAIRDGLKARGIILEDTSRGTVWSVSEK